MSCLVFVLSCLFLILLSLLSLIFLSLALVAVPVPVDVSDIGDVVALLSPPLALSLWSGSRGSFERAKEEAFVHGAEGLV